MEVEVDEIDIRAEGDGEKGEVNGDENPELSGEADAEAGDEFRDGTEEIKVGDVAGHDLKEKVDQLRNQWKNPRRSTFEDFLKGDLDGVAAGPVNRPLREMDTDVDRLLGTTAKRERVSGTSTKREKLGDENRSSREAKPVETSGPQWYDMPKPEITPEIAKDLKMIRMRNHLDPTRNFKSTGWGPEGPSYFQVGTVMDSSHDYLTGRLKNRLRKSSVREELLATRGLKKRAKRRFREVQAKSQSGRSNKTQGRPKKKRLGR